MRILSHEVFSVSHGGHGNKAKNEDEGRTEASTVVTVRGRGPGLLMQGQSARDEGLLLLLLCSGFKAVAARAGSGSHLQNEVEDMGWDGARKSGGPRSQGGLQGGVQDVIMVAVAVGVTVIALGAGVVGCLLQPHQHVHLWREQRGGSACQFAGKPTLASLEPLPPAPDSPQGS